MAHRLLQAFVIIQREEPPDMATDEAEIEESPAKPPNTKLVPILMGTVAGLLAVLLVCLGTAVGFILGERSGPASGRPI